MTTKRNMCEIFWWLLLLLLFVYFTLSCALPWRAHTHTHTHTHKETKEATRHRIYLSIDRSISIRRVVRTTCQQQPYQQSISSSVPWSLSQPCCCPIVYPSNKSIQSTWNGSPINHRRTYYSPNRDR